MSGKKVGFGHVTSSEQVASELVALVQRQAVIKRRGIVTETGAESCEVDAGVPVPFTAFNAAEEGSDFVLRPALDSSVVIDQVGAGQQDMVLAQVSTLDYAKLYGGGHGLEADAEGVRLNGGELGGLVVWAELKRELEALRAQLEAIRQVVASGVVEAGNGAPSALAVALAAALGPIKQSDFGRENLVDELVKH